MLFKLFNAEVLLNYYFYRIYLEIHLIKNIMAEQLIITNKEDKEKTYKELIPQIRSLVECEYDLIANLANISAVLKEAFNFFWVGFYLVKEEQLVLGPFQGTLACTRINYGKGVCGTAWKNEETVIVDDVNSFPGHIACSSLSLSEIVVPVFFEGKVVAVLDVDSDKYSTFDNIDSQYLNEICNLIFKM